MTKEECAICTNMGCGFKKHGTVNPGECFGFMTEASKGRFEVVTLFGQTCLFTNGRLTEKDLPKGVYCYHIRGRDDGCGFAALEKRVGCNHEGSIVSKKPFDLGDQGYIPLSMDTSPNFLGMEMTVEKFMAHTVDGHQVLHIDNIKDIAIALDLDISEYGQVGGGIPQKGRAQYTCYNRTGNRKNEPVMYVEETDDIITRLEIGGITII